MQLTLPAKFRKSFHLAKSTKEKGATETPLMRQYNQIKAKHPKAMLLFRVGDFYETFGEDAIKASNILGIILTKRKNGAAAHIELAGFPHHSINTYLPKLVRAGERVAICDQLEDPKMTKKIVKRGVTELVTPGVSFNDEVLNQKENNFLCAIQLTKKNHGIALLDVSTGELLVAQGDHEYINKLISNFNPSEILFQKNKGKEFEGLFGTSHYTYRLDDWVFTSDFADEILNKHFGTKSLKGFGVEGMAEAIIAAGAVFHYLGESEHKKLDHITGISRIEEDKYVWLDRFTIKNLELVSSPHENARTLSDILDETQTAMGSRMLRRWIMLPLKNKKPIEDRIEVVDFLKSNEKIGFELSQRLKNIGDLERLISKVAVGRVNPKEVAHLKKTLLEIDPLKKLLDTNDQPKSLSHLIEKLDCCPSLIALINKSLCEEPAGQIGKGEVIKSGWNKELDELREIAYHGKDFLMELQQRESERTEIPSLKIAFNNVFGYYIEVRNTHKDKVPEEWIRKQTLVNAERYITEELKVYEQKILGAEEKILSLETRLFHELVLEMANFITPIQLNAQILGRLDCLFSFATIAHKYNYCRPEINEGLSIDITSGRHPVIEQSLEIGEKYIANDIHLNQETQQIMMITGPNMSGKSALIRQTALIVIMAQMGCFVPAQDAKIGLVDKVFTRVGASDNISSGESTFMVEMNETASILNNISPRSLILLDEIGRGTSTYDGISIAWAIAEYLHENKKAKCKTLFATHYHELNEMTHKFSRIKNFNVSVKEVGKKILFIRKLVEGGSEHSFGIHVAKMAGMPSQVVKRSEQILNDLEAMHSSVGGKKNKEEIKSSLNDSMQLSFFQLNDPVLEQIHEELKNVDINGLTPVDALLKLNEIKKLLGN
ncbi:MAG: DNA mismatch repair protein MutS [Crocinitomicaceae bacterium]|nr:DNA mismatch repair protein MutS [Crocinitomicaceae bacterium]